MLFFSQGLQLIRVGPAPPAGQLAPETRGRSSQIFKSEGGSERILQNPETEMDRTRNLDCECPPVAQGPP